MIPHQIAKPIQVGAQKLNKYDYYAASASGPIVPFSKQAYYARLRVIEEAFRARQPKSLLDYGLNKNVYGHYQDKLGINDDALRTGLQIAGGTAAGSLAAAKLGTGLIKGGAGIGTAVGGPVGAAVGGTLGALATAGLIIGATMGGAAAGGTLTPSGMYAAADHTRNSLMGFIESPGAQTMESLQRFGATLDQLDGAAFNKAVISGIVNDDQEVFDNIERAYGMHEDGHTEFLISDIRKNMGLDIGIGNFAIDFVGEMMVSPSIWVSGGAHKMRKVHNNSTTAEVAIRASKKADVISDALDHNIIRKLSDYGMESMTDYAKAKKKFVQDVISGANREPYRKIANNIKKRKNAAGGFTFKNGRLAPIKPLDISDKDMVNMMRRELGDYFDDIVPVTLGKTESVHSGFTYTAKNMVEHKDNAKNILEVLQKDPSFSYENLSRSLVKDLKKNKPNFNYLDFNALKKSYPALNFADKMDDYLTKVAFAGTNPGGYLMFKTGKKFGKALFRGFKSVRDFYAKANQGRRAFIDVKEIDEVVYPKIHPDLKADFKKLNEDFAKKRELIDKERDFKFSELQARKSEQIDFYKIKKAEIEDEIKKAEQAKRKEVEALLEQTKVFDKSGTVIDEDYVGSLKKAKQNVKKKLADTEKRFGLRSEQYKKLSKELAEINDMLEAYHAVKFYKDLANHDLDVYLQMQAYMGFVRKHYEYRYRLFLDDVLSKGTDAKVHKLITDPETGEMLKTFDQASQYEIRRAFHQYMQKEGFLAEFEAFDAEMEGLFELMSDKTTKILKDTDNIFKDFEGLFLLTRIKNTLKERQARFLKEDQEALGEAIRKYVGNYTMSPYEDLPQTLRPMNEVYGMKNNLPKARKTNETVIEILERAGVDLNIQRGRIESSVNTITRINSADDVINMLDLSEISGDSRGLSLINFEYESTKDILRYMTDDFTSPLDEDALEDLIRYRYNLLNDEYGVSTNIKPGVDYDFDMFSETEIDEFFEDIFNTESNDVFIRSGEEISHSLTQTKITLDDKTMNMFDFMKQYGDRETLGQYEDLLKKIQESKGEVKGNEQLKNLMAMVDLQDRVISNYTYEQVDKNLAHLSMLGKVEELQFLEPLMDALQANDQRLLKTSDGDMFYHLNKILQDADLPNGMDTKLFDKLTNLKNTKDFMLGLPEKYPGYFKGSADMETNLFMGTVYDMSKELDRMEIFKLSETGELTHGYDYFHYELPQILRSKFEERFEGYIKRIGNQGDVNKEVLQATLKNQFEDALEEVVREAQRRFELGYPGTKFYGEMNSAVMDDIFDLIKEVEFQLDGIDVDELSDDLLRFKTQIREFRRDTAKEVRAHLRVLKEQNNILKQKLYSPHAITSTAKNDIFNADIGLEAARFTGTTFRRPPSFREVSRRNNLLNIFRQDDGKPFTNTRIYPSDAYDANGYTTLLGGELPSDQYKAYKVYKEMEDTAGKGGEVSLDPFVAGNPNYIANETIGFLGGMVDDPYGYVEELKKQLDYGTTTKRDFVLYNNLVNEGAISDNVDRYLDAFAQKLADPQKVGLKPIQVEKIKAAYARHVMQSSTSLEGLIKNGEFTRVGPKQLRESFFGFNVKEKIAKQVSEQLAYQRAFSDYFGELKAAPKNKKALKIISDPDVPRSVKLQVLKDTIDIKRLRKSGLTYDELLDQTIKENYLEINQEIAEILSKGDDITFADRARLDELNKQKEGKRFHEWFDSPTNQKEMAEKYKELEDLKQKHQELMGKFAEEERLLTEKYGGSNADYMIQVSKSYVKELNLENKAALIKKFKANGFETIKGQTVEDYVEDLLGRYREDVLSQDDKLNEMFFERKYQKIDFKTEELGPLDKMPKWRVEKKGGLIRELDSVPVDPLDRMTAEQWTMHRSALDRSFEQEIQEIFEEQFKINKWAQGTEKENLAKKYLDEKEKMLKKAFDAGYDQATVHKIDHLENLFTLTLGDIKTMFKSGDEFAEYVFRSSDEFILSAIAKDGTGRGLDPSKFKTVDGVTSFKDPTRGDVNDIIAPLRGDQFDLEELRRHKEGYYKKNAPTVKEVIFKNKKELSDFFEMADPEAYSIGLMTKDNFKTAKKMSYKKYRLPKPLEIYYKNLLHLQKADMLLSVSWNPTNFVDVMRKNSYLLEDLYDTKEYLRLFGDSFRYYNKHHSIKQVWYRKIRKMRDQIEKAADLGDQKTVRELKKQITEMDDIGFETFVRGEMGKEIRDEITKKVEKGRAYKYASDSEKNKIIQELYEEEIAMLVEVDKFSQTSATTDLPKFMDMMNEGALAEATNLPRKAFRYLAAENPVMKTNMNIASQIEQTGRLHGYLLDKHLNGVGHDTAIARSLRRHYDYSDKDMLEIYATLMFPFTAFPIRNMMFWAEEMQDAVKSRRYTATIDALWGSQDVEDNEYLANAKVQGYIPVGNTLIKIGDSRGQAWRMGTGFFDVASQRMNPILRESIAVLNKDKSVGEALISAMPLTRRIPQAMEQYRRYQDGSDHTDALKATAPSLFGTYYQNRTYSYPKYRHDVYKQTYDRYGNFRRDLSNSDSSFYRIRSIMYQAEQRRYR